MKSNLQKRMFVISVGNIKFKEVIIGNGKTEGVSVPTGVFNPFKKSFTYTGEMTFKGEITKDMADMYNLILPNTAMSRCIPFTLIDKYFHVCLWMSRYLANLDFNKKFYEKEFRKVAIVTAYILND